MSAVAELLDQNHALMALRFDEASRNAGVRPCDSTFVCVVIRCDDRLAQGLLYASSGSLRFEVGSTPGSAIGVLSVSDLSCFLEIADQETIALALKSRPMVNRFWALGICDGVMLESQRLD